jgi:hypothetical protein
MGYQPDARPLPTQDNTEQTQTSMPRVGFEQTIPVLHCAKTFQTLGRSATETGAANLFVENMRA